MTSDPSSFRTEAVESCADKGIERTAVKNAKHNDLKTGFIFFLLTNEPIRPSRQGCHGREKEM
jgi:hypothetical protein